MPTNKRFENKVVLVTGATSGIGRETAVAFAREGAQVVFTGRREAEGEQTLQRVREVGTEGLFLKSDVTKEEDAAAMVEKAVSAYGRLDAAFNNAGTEGDMVPTVDQTVENYRRVFDVNVLGLLLSMKYEMKHMLKHGGGTIVNNASIAGVIGMPTGTVYFGSKHAVLGMTKAAALEVAQHGIRINAVSPAVIETEMFDRFSGGGSEEARASFTALHPIGRLGQPREIAEPVLFLCSEAASFITGQNLIVDGAFTAQ